jgi:hypothetical protein
MSRIDNLASNGLIDAITTLKTEMDEFKTAQLTSGRAGILSYISQSANTWDYTGTVGSDAGGTATTNSTYSINFTADGSQSPVIANLSFAIFVNGTDTAHQLTPQVNAYNDGSGRTAILSYGSLSETQLAYTQTFSLLTQKAITVYVKAYAVGSSKGTVTAVRTA